MKILQIHGSFALPDDFAIDLYGDDLPAALRALADYYEARKDADDGHGAFPLIEQFVPCAHAFDVGLVRDSLPLGRRTRIYVTTFETTCDPPDANLSGSYVAAAAKKLLDAQRALTPPPRSH